MHRRQTGKRLRERWKRERIHTPVCRLRASVCATAGERQRRGSQRNPARDECDQEAGVAENTHGSCPCFRTQVPDQLIRHERPTLLLRRPRVPDAMDPKSSGPGGCVPSNRCASASRSTWRRLSATDNMHEPVCTGRIGHRETPSSLSSVRAQPCVCLNCSLEPLGARVHIRARALSPSRRRSFPGFPFGFAAHLPPAGACIGLRAAAAARTEPCVNLHPR